MAKSFSQLRLEVLRRRLKRATGPVVLALDAMGTDHHPSEILHGAYDAVVLYPNMTVIATGPQDLLESIIETYGWKHPRLMVENATEVVAMGEHPADSLKKEQSSIAVACRLVKNGVAHGIVSPGNTGATMAHALRQWKRLKGISRPAIVAFMPHPTKPTIMMDMGANVDCRAQHLLDFGIMGTAYAKCIFGRRDPKVGTISNGEEDSKGNAVVQEAHQLFHDSPLNFVGNVEGRELFRAAVDVAVCDGFVGNVLLKFGEGIVEFIFGQIRKGIAETNIVSKIGAFTILPVFRSMKKSMDSVEFGGAPLLGLNGTCIICHGSARHKAITNALRVASELVSTHLNDHIRVLAEAVNGQKKVDQLRSGRIEND
ncbi:phosphate acyltransferase PlsX [Candidatus Sumerlaeota bacterium]|nr:phosphate acyltransferase PlsX [Candidatus Sumerlaeales bacterium]NLD61772.1 phosphate acyltransferase PlsX [Candidatus Sumerlaeota bacterium]